MDLASNACMTTPKCTKEILKGKHLAKFVFTDTRHADAATCRKRGELNEHILSQRKYKTI